jgi:hypothetical protein
MLDSSDWDASIREALLQTMADKVTAASRETYFNEWYMFQNWKSNTNPPFAGPATSSQIHGYLAKRWMDDKWKSSATLWTKLSILRTMVHIVEKRDIKNDEGDRNIQAWLKSLGKRQKPKQSATFSRNDVQRYLEDGAHDALTLPARLLLLIGCNIGCRSQTLYRLEFKHIQETAEGDLRITVDFVQKHDQAVHWQLWIILKKPETPNCRSVHIFEGLSKPGGKVWFRKGFFIAQTVYRA